MRKDEVSFLGAKVLRCKEHFNLISMKLITSFITSATSVSRDLMGLLASDVFSSI